MITHDGRFILPAIRPKEMPTTKDLAVHLGRMTRYAGALWVPVLTHSLVTAEIAFNQSAEDYELWARAIIRDCHEAITGGVVSASKGQDVRQLQDEIDAWMMPKVFHVKPLDPSMDDHKSLELADMKAFHVEMKVLSLGDLKAYQRHGKISLPSVTSVEVDIGQSILMSSWRDAAFTTDPNSSVISAFKASLDLICCGFFEKARQCILIEDVNLSLELEVHIKAGGNA